jgi:hypothetical protein
MEQMGCRHRNRLVAPLHELSRIQTLIEVPGGRWVFVGRAGKRDAVDFVPRTAECPRTYDGCSSMRPSRLVLVGFVLACQAPHAPGPPLQPERACAAALPLLAKQHTPNATRIYLAPLTVSGDRIELGTPVLMTSKQGYVNQPAFSPEGNGIYFTWRPVDSQADIWFHDLRSGEEHAVTCTSEEEYIASPTPDGGSLTVLRVERDLTRKLTVLKPDGTPQQVLFPSVTSMGAYRWADDHTVAIFTFDPERPSRLILGDVATGTLAPVAEQVGAALARIPGTHALSYIDNSDDHQAKLMRVDLATHATAGLIALPEGVASVSWLSDRTLLAGSQTRILHGSTESSSWREVADLAGKITGTITGISLGPDHRRVAIVVRLDS